MELRKRIVMLVDDEDSVRGVIRGYLESLGIYVLEAGNATMAIRLAMNSPLSIDLLITDILLPRTNGRDLANRVCMHRPDIKVLFISGYPMDVLKHHGLCPSHAELLPKPFTQVELEEKVRQAMENGPIWKSISMAKTGSGPDPV